MKKTKRIKETCPVCKCKFDGVECITCSFIKDWIVLYNTTPKRKLELSTKLCPNCKTKWNGIECDNCGFDTGFDPNWD